MFLLQIFFWVSAFVIFWAMVGYPLSLLVIDRIVKPNENKKLNDFEPTVTIMIVAHNEEKVIFDKLVNVVNITYPREKIEILVASDNSTDKTNEIVDNFINTHPEHSIRLYKAKKKMGKTNAQNEAQKTVETELLIMTDANSIISKDAIKEIVSSFSSKNIAYVCGRLQYENANVSDSSSNESSYWNLDLKMRDIESRLQTITAGNGALYSVRNSDYVAVPPIESHDSAFPTLFALQGKRAIMNTDAMVTEKAGETTEDEFKRKVRMNRVLLEHIMPSAKILNFIKFKWFSYFYLGHRTSRYLLWLAHLLLFISTVILSFQSVFYLLITLVHIVLFILIWMHSNNYLNNKLIQLIYYYMMTILAQFVGVYKKITGQAKPFWDKAESTR